MLRDGARETHTQEACVVHMPMVTHDSHVLVTGQNLQWHAPNTFPFIIGAKQAKQRKLMQRQAIELVRNLCVEILELDDARAFSLLQQPLHLAAKLGIPEIIVEIVEACPPVIWSSDEEKRNVFQLAVLNRRENVFNLIYRMSNYRHFVTRYIDPHGNNILHLAGKLPSPDRLNLVSGAALKVQRELQWFKEVETFVQPAQKEAKNNEGKTPAMVFAEEHQELMKDGETWMKNTATSCTVAATLIVTVAFAAAVHVPGGNDSKNGHPLLSGVTAFNVFAVVDAVSLFSAVSAILLFLSILTSRYSEDDFLKALPRGLIAGLTMLFVSILSMMTAFCAAIYLGFGPNYTKILIPLGGVFVSPVVVVVLLPLLHRVFTNTYSGLFPKQKNCRILH